MRNLNELLSGKALHAFSHFLGESIPDECYDLLLTFVAPQIAKDVAIKGALLTDYRGGSPIDSKTIETVLRLLRTNVEEVEAFDQCKAFDSKAIVACVSKQYKHSIKEEAAVLLSKFVSFLFVKLGEEAIRQAKINERYPPTLEDWLKALTTLPYPFQSPGSE